MSIWDDTDKIKKTIASSKTRAEVIEKLNRSTTTATYRRLKVFEQQHNVDVSHFKPWYTQKRKNAAFSNRRTYESIFCEHSTAGQSVVKRRVIQDKLIEYKCANCNNNGTWDNKLLSLQLEHKNGIHNDHRLENLCFLCPNCHSQTSTFCGRNVEGKQTKKTRAEYLSDLRAQLKITYQPMIDKVINSEIDFTKLGWSVQVARLLKKNPQKVKYWMTKYMPDFYAQCYHRRGVK